MELRHLGWNLMSLGFVGTIVISMILGWGAIQQATTILNHRKAESIAVTAFAATGALMIVQCVYGYSKDSIALTFAGVALGLPLLQIVVLVAIFRGFNWWEWLMIALFVATVVATIILPQKEEVFFIFSFVTVLTGLTQPWAIWRHRTAGDLDSRLIWKLFISTWFWIPYGFAIRDLTLMIVPLCFFVIHLANLLLMKKYPAN